MSALAPISTAAVRRYLQGYDLGEILDSRLCYSQRHIQGLTVHTTQGRYLLQVVRGQSKRDAVFEESLLDHLSRCGVDVPQLVYTSAGDAHVSFASRERASLFQHVDGRVLGAFELQAEHCFQAGAFLARLHVQGASASTRRNKFSPRFIMGLLERRATRAYLREHVRHIRELAVELVRHHWAEHLPSGLIHGQFFVNRARFSKGRLGKVVDFSLAARGPLVYDLAAALLDWSFVCDALHIEHARAFVQGYQHERPLLPEERGHLYELCRYAATRFAVSTLCEHELALRRGKTPYVDYTHFLRRLQQWQDLGESRFQRALWHHASQKIVPGIKL